MGVQLLSESSKIQEEGLEMLARVMTKQLHEHVAAVWGIKSPLSVSTPSIMHHPSWYKFIFVDEIPEAPDALAYHDVGDDGIPYAKIGITPTIDAGDTVSSAVSHECVELQVDVFCQEWSWCEWRECLVAKEACDPVQDQSYNIGDISVSNFVTPWYFREDGLSHSRDYLGNLPADRPVSISSGGYLITMQGGRVDNVFGDLVTDAKRAERNNSHGRTFWRHVQGALLAG